MRRGAAILVVVLSAWGATATTAHAKDMSGRFGVGTDTSAGWNALSSANALELNTGVFPGLSMVFHVSPMFGMQAMFGLGLAKPDEPDDKTVIWNTAVRAIINISLSDEVSLGGVIGIGLSGVRFNPEVGSHSSAIWLSFELGIRPEWFITNWFSMHTQVGIAIAILDDELSPFIAGSNDGAIAVNIFGSANLLGNAGFTFWF